MTEWNAAEYDRIAGLQQAMAGEVLGLLRLSGSERVLDVGCGNGKITVEVASRVPSGSVVGVDPSHAMVEFATQHFSTPAHRNLSFRVGDARTLPFRDEFDQVISFNALHWVHEQDAALAGIRSALKPGGLAHLRLVSAGPRKSLEDVIEETAHQPRWAAAFQGVPAPYLHLDPEDYAARARGAGFAVDTVTRADHSWNFGSREAFRAFAQVTFVEWTRRVPESDRPRFIEDALDAYQPVARQRPGEEHCFKFYQMDVSLRRPSA
ncbi:MAG: class I SAM-dependent methyltransferase [Verrucomicrobiales bacterium]|nr:class I SAM-dependent methyltransferase [Verrucomicrobiales bacterium]